MRSWQTDDGLPQNSVRSITSGRRGYIWFGTEEGLVRFDGARFSVINEEQGPVATSNFISAVLPKYDQEGLWVATDGDGLLNWTGGRLQQAVAPELLPSGNVSAAYQDRTGALWIGTREGLSRLKNGAVQTWRVAEGLAHDYVRSIFQDASGRIWIGTYGGLNYMEEGRLKSAPWQELAGVDVRAITETTDGNLFFGTNGEGLFRAAKDQLRRYTTKEGLGHDDVASLAVAPDGALWIATYGGGVSRWKDDQFASITAEQGLSNDLCLSIYPDAQGLIWVGHNGGGLTCLLPRRVKVIDKQAGLAGDIALPILETREGDVWVGTATAGVTRFRDGVATTFDATNGLPRNVVLALGQDHEGAVWIATAGGSGVTRYKNGGFTTFTRADGLSDGTVTAILADRKGRVWFGTEAGGISIYDGKRFTSLHRGDGLVSESVVSLLESSSGDIWIGTHSGGISRWRGEKLETLLSERTFGKVYTLHDDGAGYVWAGTSAGGLLRISSSGEMARVTEAAGLHGNEILGIAADGDGNFWLSSARGITRVSRQQLMAVCDGRALRVEARFLDKSDGMPSAECNGGVSPSSATLRNGEIWFPTMRGVAVITPGSLATKEGAFRPIIEGFNVDEQPLPLGGEMRLGSSSRHFEFVCTVPAFRSPYRVRFRYRLDGFDEQWSAPTDRRTAHYTRLPAGHYTFRVASAAEDGTWSEAATSVRFSIIPPFYRTKTFFALFACAAAGLVITLHQRRVSSLHGNNTQLEESVAARTAELARANEELKAAKERADRANAAKTEFLSRMSHELRTPLNAILGFAQLLEGDDLTPQQDYSVQHILNGGHHLLGLINEVLDLARIEAGRVDLAIEPVDVSDVVAESVALIHPIAAERNVEIIEPVREYPAVKVAADRPRLKQVLLNLLANAIKYNTYGGNVRVTWAVHDQLLRLTVADTGEGIPAEDIARLFIPFERLGAEKTGTEGTGLGLSVCKQLIESMQGTIEIESEVGRGSSFTIALPLFSEATATTINGGEEDFDTESTDATLSTARTANSEPLAATDLPISRR